LNRGLLGNEGNEYPITDASRMMIDDSQRGTQKSSSFRYSWRCFKRYLNRTYKINKINSKNIKTTHAHKKKLEKTQKQLNELREDFDKFQNEAKKTIKKREREMK
jgi:hypothetical protein